MRVCVTGGAGFIGSHLVDRLVADGHAVAVLDDLSTGRRSNLADVESRIRFVAGDVRDSGDAREVVRGAEIVFHLAALASVARSLARPREVVDVNVAGTLSLLEAARASSARRVVFASSSSVYGDPDRVPVAETVPLRPRSPYAASKAAGEGFLSAFQATHGLEAVVLRFFSVYGPRQQAEARYAAAVPRFVAACLAGETPCIEGDGLQTRDFTYVEDVVEAVCRAAALPEALPGPVNVGAGRRTSILDLAAAVASACDTAVTPQHVGARAGDVRHSQADIGRAAAWIGWTPSTALDEGIRRTVASARDRDRAVESPG
jgi:nucleoside-diphosphate-sugar epimerase